MKIVHLCEYASAGVLTYLNTILPYQEKQIEVETITVFASKKNSGKIYTSDKVKVIYYEYDRKNFYRVIPFLNKAIKLENPDILHLHSTFAGIFGRVLNWRRNYKIIYCAHGWSFFRESSKINLFLFKLIENILSLNTDTIIDISKHEYGLIEKMPLIRKKHVLVNNGIADTFSHIDKNNESLFDNDKFNLLFVGRFDRQKGLDILVRCFKEFQDELADINLYCVGDNIVDSPNFVRENLPQNIFMLGSIMEGIDSYYHEADAVIVPSRWEGFGFVAVEAMKNGKALLVSNRGQLPYFVENDELIFSLDINDIKDKILKLSVSNNIDNIGGRNREVYERKYTSDTLNKKLFKIYEGVLRD